MNIIILGILAHIKYGENFRNRESAVAEYGLEKCRVDNGDTITQLWI